MLFLSPTVLVAAQSSFGQSGGAVVDQAGNIVAMIVGGLLLEGEDTGSSAVPINEVLTVARGIVGCGCDDLSQRRRDPDCQRHPGPPGAIAHTAATGRPDSAGSWPGARGAPAASVRASAAAAASALASTASGVRLPCLPLETRRQRCIEPLRRGAIIWAGGGIAGGGDRASDLEGPPTCRTLELVAGHGRLSRPTPRRSSGAGAGASAPLAHRWRLHPTWARAGTSSRASTSLVLRSRSRSDALFAGGAAFDRRSSHRRPRPETQP